MVSGKDVGCALRKQVVVERGEAPHDDSDLKSQSDAAQVFRVRSPVGST